MRGPTRKSVPAEVEGERCHEVWKKDWTRPRAYCGCPRSRLAPGCHGGRDGDERERQAHAQRDAVFGEDEWPVGGEVVEAGSPHEYREETCRLVEPVMPPAPASSRVAKLNRRLPRVPPWKRRSRRRHLTETGRLLGHRSDSEACNLRFAPQTPDQVLVGRGKSSHELASAFLIDDKAIADVPTATVDPRTRLSP